VVPVEDGVTSRHDQPQFDVALFVNQSDARSRFKTEAPDRQ
jgi:hypothetical protein